MQSLPQDVLQRIVVFAAMDVRDVARYAQVCCSLRDASSGKANVWKNLALLKFGEIATASEALYISNWKALMIDDNRRGAFPTLATPLVCNYAYNRLSYYFCCIVQSVKWDRHEGEIRVYIDVRGETDLRHPMGSSITQLPSEAAENRANHDFTRIPRLGGPRRFLVQARPSVPPSRPSRWERGVTPTRFVAEEKPTARHFKGYLTFPTSGDVPPGRYSFCYANSNIQHGSDYMPVNLFTVSSQSGGLAEAFHVEHYLVRRSDPDASTTTVYSADESPFVNDTPEKERMRWASTVPEGVMNRGDNQGMGEWTWFV